MNNDILFKQYLFEHRQTTESTYEDNLVDYGSTGTFNLAYEYKSGPYTYVTINGETRKYLR